MKRILCTLLMLCLLWASFACTAQAAEEFNVELESEIGAFEITAEQREMAKANEAGYAVLDAGRGNPNWINTQVRYAFTRLMEYALQECERTLDQGSMAGQASAEGLSERFDAAMDPDDETDAFLIQAVECCVDRLGLEKDELLKELVDAIIGDYYPEPSRCLPNIEVILNVFLQTTLYNGTDLSGQTRVFPTEGGSAAMVYIFDSLSHNHLLRPGDRIAIATPIFTPYLQIPNVKDYDLVSVEITSSSEDEWDITEEQFAKLEDPSVKAFFLVNPSNPSSHALSRQALERLAQAVEKNPDLIILTDDVYGTFAEDFQTVYSVLPYNTILVYSFSKLYGVTGWRLGLIAMNEENVCDRLLSQLPESDREYLAQEYSIVVTDPEQLCFLDRAVADSRSIGLYHTSGLSTPSQAFMALTALSHLIYACEGEEDPYIRQANATVHERYVALMRALGLDLNENKSNTEYYTLVDIDALCQAHYGTKFVEWFDEAKSDVEFLDDLAARKGVVLMYGPGFKAPDRTVRISLANLNTEDYVEIARRLFELLDEYMEESGLAIPDAA